MHVYEQEESNKQRTPELPISFIYTLVFKLINLITDLSSEQGFYDKAFDPLKPLPPAGKKKKITSPNK